jgi:putative heme transporter
VSLTDPSPGPRDESFPQHSPLPPGVGSHQLLGDGPPRPPADPRPGLPSRLQSWGQSAWQALGILALIAASLWLLWHLRVVVFPLFIAVLLASVLAPIERALRRRGTPDGIAAAAPVLALLALIVAAGFLIVPAIADQLTDLGSKISDGLDNVEEWVDRNQPFGLDGRDVASLRRDATGTTPDADTIATGARTAGTVVAGTILAFIAAFFFLRDGRKLVRWLIGTAPVAWRDDARTMARTVERSLVGYVSGAAVLGLVEGVTIGITVALVGGELPVVLGLLTFIAAFVPFVGAVVAGLLAIGVTLVVAGPVPALIVAVVAVVVQQLDNDLLAPLIYGRFVRLHPLVVLSSLAVGIESAGLIGAIAAVPVAATIAGVARVLRQRSTRSRLGLDEHLRPHPPAVP